MNPDPAPLRQTTRHEVESESVSESQQVQAGVEFESPEALLKHDRSQTAVPEAVAGRVAQSVGGTPDPSAPTPWWRRIF